MPASASDLDPATLAATFGALISQRRTALGLSQEELALATGVGRRFIIELEAGKASCQLGLALMAMATLGLRIPSGDPSAT